MARMRTASRAWLVVTGLGLGTARADAPKIDTAAQMRAERILSMPDDDPVARVNQLLAARKLDDSALFVLAATHPGLVQQIVDPEYKLAVTYLASLPAPDLFRIRKGDTIIHSASELVGDEKAAAEALAEQLGFKPKQLKAIRVGPLEDRIFRVEVTAGKKKKSRTATVELAWPSTPERDAQSRAALSKYFGALPNRIGYGAGSTLPLQQSSFEEPNCLNDAWSLDDGVVLGTRIPVADVSIDHDVAIDGNASLRFHATEETRLFPTVTQSVQVAPSSHVRARVQFRASGLKVEYQQRPTDVGIWLQFEDADGRPLGTPKRAVGRLGTHAWEQLEVDDVAPQDAAQVRVGLLSAVSGTAWFDGVSLELVQ